MTFYAVVSDGQAGKALTDLSLERACLQRGIEYKRIITTEITLDDLATAPYARDSLLYRISLSPKATAIETMLATLRPDIFTTIYYPRSLDYPNRNLSELLRQTTSKLPVIPTEVIDETWLEMERDALDERVNRLSGFPIVIKTLGLSHGQGVERVDSMDELLAWLNDHQFTEYKTIARKYLTDYIHYRLIVVGGRVVAALEYHKPNDDFRTNATKTPFVTAIDLDTVSEEVKNIAIKGVELRGSLLGGVDILIEQPTNVAMLAEVNVPCNFARAEQPTGVHIGDKIVEAMLTKQATRGEL